MNASQEKEPATKADVEKAIDRAVEKLGDMVGTGFAVNDKRFNAIEVRLDGVESRLGRIENLLIEEQRRKIENLETRMKRLEDAIAV